MLEAAVQAFMKLCIMVGVVVVGGMAYHLYGPPAGEASALLDRIVTTARTALCDRSGGPTPAAEQPRAFPIGDLTPVEPAALTSAAPRVGEAAGPMTQPMAPLEPLPSPESLAARAMPSGVDQLVEELRRLGVEDIQLTAWGAEGDLHRFACCAPLPGESGFVRHFDAIEPDAQLAAARVFDQVRQWRTAHPTLPR